MLNESGAALKRAADPALTSTSARVPPPTAPPISHLGLQQYGRVADDYVPPIPATFSSGELTISMQKETPGALTEIKIGGVTPSIFTGTDTSVADFLRAGDRIVSEDARAIDAESNARGVIACTYKSDVVPRRVFWYKVEPSNAARQRLTQRLPVHPLLKVGPPQPTCPANLELAISAAMPKQIEPSWFPWSGAKLTAVG